MKKYCVISTIASLLILISAVFLHRYLYINAMSSLPLILVLLSAFQSSLFLSESKTGEPEKFQTAYSYHSDLSNNKTAHAELFKLHAIIKILCIPFLLPFCLYFSTWWKLLSFAIFMLSFIVAKLFFILRSKTRSRY